VLRLLSACSPSWPSCRRSGSRCGGGRTLARTGCRPPARPSRSSPPSPAFPPTGGPPRRSGARALSSLRHELDQNTAILRDARFRREAQSIGQVYPRLMLGAVDTAFISGALSSPRDRELLRRLLAWRNTAEDFNRRLDITEIRLCTIENLSGDELSALRDMAREPRGYFALVGRRIGELREALDAAGGWTPPWPVRRVLAEPDRETTLREEAVDLTGRTRGALDARQHGLRGNLDVPDA
jgi:hypothetical protein